MTSAPGFPPNGEIPSPGSEGGTASDLTRPGASCPLSAALEASPDPALVATTNGVVVMSWSGDLPDKDVAERDEARRIASDLPHGSIERRFFSHLADALDGRPLILISIDGFRWDYLQNFAAPHLTSLARDGVVAQRLIPSFPTLTFPNHYTLVTGLYPGHHGIVANAFYDPARREWYRPGAGQTVRDSTWYGGEPIWVTAERHGVKSGVYFWPGSEAAIQGVRPSYVAAYDGTVPNASRVNSAMAWLR